MTLAPLSPDALRGRGIDPGIAFDTTEDLEDLEAPFGQARAAEALRLAIALRRDGYNAYAMGPTGAGKHALVLQLLGRAALEAATPSDWCYVYDFGEPRRPRAIELPPGRGGELARDLARVVDELRVAIPAAFENAGYRTRIQLLEKELEETRDRQLEEVRRLAEEKGFALLRTPAGYGFAPVQEGAVIEPDRFRDLPADEQERLRGEIAALQDRLQVTLRGFPDLERHHRERVREANREVAAAAAAHVLDELRRRYADLPAVLAHLQAVQQDVVDNVHDFVAGDDGEGDVAAQMRKLLADGPALRRYGVNVMADRGGHPGAPVVYEDLPTLANLVGRIEHHAHFGTLVTDFTLIRPGALHRANGGFLVLDARKLLAQPFAWEELKRAVRARELRIEAPERLLGIASTATLEPEPIPLDVRVVIVGDRLVHELLTAVDPEFGQLFKIDADFEDAVPRSPEVDRDFARLVATLARRDGLHPLDRSAVDRVLREATRLAGDSTRLTADAGAIRDLLREADLGAARSGRTRTTAADVRAAVDAGARRSGRLRELVHEEIRRGTLVVETSGTRTGQVNGLCVIDAGRRPFGRPSRITARVRLGPGEVVDIEREVALGGPIHSKGVLILAGYLGARYCPVGPLAVAASIVFEQSYTGVEGDSASVAELYALLSAIADVPIRQSLAVTGSVDQLGRVQAVGAVSEKIEGFFEVCRARGLTGEQGVLVPRANVPHLVLREEVLAAVVEGRFRLYAIETVDDGVEVLTGLPAGKPEPSGRFAEGSFDARVASRLEIFAARARELAALAHDQDRRRR